MATSVVHLHESVNKHNYHSSQTANTHSSKSTAFYTGLYTPIPAKRLPPLHPHNTSTLQFVITSLFTVPTGHVQGDGEEPHPQAVCRAGDGAGHCQAVLPRGWTGSQENLLGQEPGAAVSALCPLPVHPDHRLTHQDFRWLSDFTRYAGYCQTDTRLLF